MKRYRIQKSGASWVVIDDKDRTAQVGFAELENAQAYVSKKLAE